MGERAKIFVSYSHIDDELVQTVLEHVEGLARNFGAELWIDKQLNVGYEWHDEITQQLSDANVALLFLSPAFMRSEFIQSVEVPSLLARSGHHAEPSASCS